MMALTRTRAGISECNYVLESKLGLEIEYKFLVVNNEKRKIDGKR